MQPYNDHPFTDTQASVATYFCPGRINLIGEHIDYNGGLVLPAAIGLGTTLYIRKRDDSRIVLQSKRFEGVYEVDLTQPQPTQKTNAWADYPLGCIDWLRTQGHTLQGFDLLYDSDLPIGSGLSSSASIEVLTLYALLHECEIRQYTREQIALAAQHVENNYIGVSCGIMDQFAVALGQSNNAIRLNCQTLQYEYISAQIDHYSLLILSTNKPRSLIHSAYNQRLAECQEALYLINQVYSYPNLCSVPLNVAYDVLEDKHPTLLKRTRHCITEQERVMRACAAIENKDIKGFAEALKGSHLSLRNDYEVTGPELDALYNIGHSLPGCIAVRMTGAGFGGCAIALVANDHKKPFAQALKQAYHQATGLQAEVLECKIADGVKKLN